MPTAPRWPSTSLAGPNCRQLGLPPPACTRHGPSRPRRRLAAVAGAVAVDAVVTPNAMPFILLGNSYLTRFQMTRNNDQMVLEKRF